MTYEEKEKLQNLPKVTQQTSVKVIFKYCMDILLLISALLFFIFILLLLLFLLLPFYINTSPKLICLIQEAILWRD